MAKSQEHLIGLLLGRGGRLAPRVRDARPAHGRGHRTGRHRSTTCRTERVTIEPFNLRDKPRYDLVIDRLAHWYYHPREWLKKVALDGRRLPAQQPVHVPVHGEALGATAPCCASA